MSKRKIILDTDPGFDDAVAIALAALSDKIELLGIIAVAGNQTLDKVSKNLQNISEYLEIKCPIAKGMSRAIIQEHSREKSFEKKSVHGETGLDGVEFPFKEPKINFDKRHGVFLIIDLCMQNEKVTIVTIGPMTDIAMALRIQPKIKEHIEEIVIMGGSTGRGNVTASAEFNIYEDPEAAYIAFTSGIPIKMNGLDVTKLANVTEEIIQRFMKINTKSSKLFVDCMINLRKNLCNFFKSETCPVHDAVAIACLIDPDVVKFKKMFVEIEISMCSSYGRTNCDISNYLGNELNAEVGIDLDVEKFWQILEETFKKF